MGPFSIPVYRRCRARREAEPRALFYRGRVDLHGSRDDAAAAAPEVGDAAVDDGAAAEALAAVATFSPTPPSLVNLLEEQGASDVDQTLLQPERSPAALLLYPVKEEEEEASDDALDDPVS